MELDLTRLTRDYVNNPLQRGEPIPGEDLRYLLIENNLTVKQTSKIIGRNPIQINKHCKINGIHKPKKSKMIKEPVLPKKEVKVVVNQLSTVFDTLLQKYPDTMMDYKSTFSEIVWDYYIPSKDLYILYHVSPLHCGEPFNSTNPEHWEKVKQWANEAQNEGYSNSIKNHFAKLINNWTIIDVLKRNTAIARQLNFKEFFTEKEFMDWLQE